MYDDSAISSDKKEFDGLMENIKDLTDLWVGKMRSGAPPPHPPFMHVTVCAPGACRRWNNSVPAVLRGSTAVRGVPKTESTWWMAALSVCAVAVVVLRP